jgi:hypothetical protein
MTVIDPRHSCDLADMRRRIIVTVGLLALACGSEGQAEGTGAETGDTTETGGEPLDRNLCDGSQDLRLAWVHGGGGLIAAEIQREIGFYYLYVRGDCHYWVVPFQRPPEIEVFETHTGVLDEAAEAELAELVRYGEWDGLAGHWPEPGGADIPTTYVHDGEQMIVCDGICPEAPAPVVAIEEAGFSKFLELWQAGEALDDAPMRVLATPVSSDAPGEHVPWTVDLALADIAVSPEVAMQQGVSTLIEDPETAVALREFRAMHADGLADFFEFNVDVGPDESYALYLRDTVPFEDAQGLVPTPPWPGG